MTQPKIGKCFPAFFLLHYQTSENTFSEFTFSEFTFPGIHFSKENYFPANKRGLKKSSFSAFSFFPSCVLSFFLFFSCVYKICFCMSGCKNAKTKGLGGGVDVCVGVDVGVGG